jgi:hypothetical protein
MFPIPIPAKSKNGDHKGGPQPRQVLLYECLTPFDPTNRDHIRLVKLGG